MAPKVSSCDTVLLSHDAWARGEGAATDGLGTTHQWSCDSFPHFDAFRGLDDQLLKRLDRHFELRHFAAGTVLLEQGESARGLYMLTRGAVDVLNIQTGSRIDRDGPGGILGEMSLVTGQPCSARVLATSDVDARFLSAESYRELCGEHPELEIALSQLVSDRLGGRELDALCGKQLGGYRLVRCVSRGGMGVVYEARTIPDDSPVALKMLRHRFIYDDRMISRFDHEAALLAQLRHRCIVSFHHHFLAYRTRFLVLDYCDGADLHRVLVRRGRLPESVARGVLGQIASGLQHAHQHGVLHRDLKPANVLIDRSGQAMITDFGLSCLVEADAPECKAVGTPPYMPIEQFRAEDSGPACDWYAMACLMYELLTGKLLFPQTNYHELYEAKRQHDPSAALADSGISGDLREIIRCGLAPDYHERTMDLERMARWAEPAPGLF